MWLDTSARLQRRHVESIAACQMPDGFDGCAFCNDFIAGQG